MEIFIDVFMYLILYSLYAIIDVYTISEPDAARMHLRTRRMKHTIESIARHPQTTAKTYASLGTRHISVIPSNTVVFVSRIRHGKVAVGLPAATRVIQATTSFFSGAPIKYLG